MDWILAFLATGIGALLAGIGVAFNTSTGGTRSDHQDSSGLLVGLGGILMLTALVGVIWEVIKWLTAQ